MTIDRPRVEAWIARYVELWRAAGTERLGELFTDDARYSTGPYEKPRTGLEAIARMWDEERISHTESFEIETEIVAVDGDTAVIRVEVDYGEPRVQQYRDLWIARLDSDGRCTSFEEWPFWPPGTDGVVAGHGSAG